MSIPSERDILYQNVGEIFGPSPISSLDLFAGRNKERSAILDAILQKGQHAIIFGERGVGKTSLASILSPYLESMGRAVIAPKVNCAASDDFNSVWRKIFSQITVSANKDFLQTVSEKIPILNQLPDPITPLEVQNALLNLGSQTILVIIIDEFDRLKDKEIFSDVIKSLADYTIPVTIILVGVATTVLDLISLHQSVERCLKQVHLSRMSPFELVDIIDKGHKKLGMTMDDDAKKFVSILSQGLPHYVHEITRFSTRQAIRRESTNMNVTMDDLNEGLKIAVEQIQESMRTSYQKATLSVHKDSLYSSVLLACAVTKTDEFGFFSAVDIQNPFCKITGKAYAIGGFSRHLHSFCTLDRDHILEKHGKIHNFKFRFSDPLMKPFVLIKAITESRVSRSLIEEFL
jgi:hypothetical protein